MNFLEKEILKHLPTTAWKLFSEHIGGVGHTALADTLWQMQNRGIIEINNGKINKK